jgi:hypothetical protein
VIYDVHLHWSLEQTLLTLKTYACLFLVLAQEKKLRWTLMAIVFLNVSDVCCCLDWNLEHTIDTKNKGMPLFLES